MSYSKRKWKKKHISRLYRFYRTAVLNDLSMVDVQKIIKSANGTKRHHQAMKKSKEIIDWESHEVTFMGCYATIPVYPESKPDSIMYRMMDKYEMMSELSATEYHRIKSYWLYESSDPDASVFFR